MSHCINPLDLNCPLCQRIFDPDTIQDHHLIPRTFKGKETIRLHKICHQKLHTTFSEREMEKYYNTIDHILEHDEIVKFVKWVKKQPPEYYDKNDDTKQRKRKRR
jgi:hypothetical protein